LFIFSSVFEFLSISFFLYELEIATNALPLKPPVAGAGHPTDVGGILA